MQKRGGTVMNRTLKSLLGIILGLIIIFAYYNTFYSIEYSMQDMIYQKPSETTYEIAIIGVDEESLEEYGRWPWSREKITNLVKIIEQGNPAVIGIDILLSEKSDENLDKALVDEIKKHDNIVLAKMGKFNNYTKANNMEAIKMVEPFKELNESAMTGHINVFIDKDGVVRKTPLFYDYKGQKVESFPYQIYKKYCENQGIESVKLENIPLDNWNRMNIWFNEGSELTTKNERNNIRYEEISINRILNGEVPPEYLENRIVLIGPYATGIDDYYYTPLIKDEPVFGIQINANIVQNLLEKKFKTEANDYVNVLILLILAIITNLLFRKIKPIVSLVILILITTGYIFLCTVLNGNNYIVYISYPIIWIVLHYVLALLMRYVEKMKEVKDITSMFGKYVSPKIVKELISKGEKTLKLGGTKKYVTLFFVDIRGFTSMSEKLEPEIVVSVLNEYFETCVNSIFKYDGTLDKFVGDEIMAVFNSPIDLANHELAAVKSAIHMRDSGVEMHDRIKEEYGVDVRFGIGINSGEAVIGNIGTSFKMDYTCIGDAVNTAARLQAVATQGQIIISKVVYDKIKDYVEVTDLGEVKVKGKEDAIKIYQVDKLVVSE
ncbi:MAG TPA: hypothetical protein DEP72_04885 [Clostridiales bacterium]|nr:MAG: hypothetical protein A2Y18_01990 [Clostridiales bacterium GWD2_32_19]HCC07475.1 hypothetical protein [Clostridiales bacterium]